MLIISHPAKIQLPKVQSGLNRLARRLTVRMVTWGWILLAWREEQTEERKRGRVAQHAFLRQVQLLEAVYQSRYG